MVEQTEQQTTATAAAADNFEEVVTDASVFKAETNILVDETAFDFSVRNPQDSGGHIVYEVTGKDKQGEWSVKRRYNEFYVLRDSLKQRFPSVPIPLVPPKKSLGNKDLVFLQERRYYLERFLRKLARFDFIIESQEFQLFSRPNGIDVEKGLNRLPKLGAGSMYDRMKEWSDIND